MSVTMLVIYTDIHALSLRAHRRSNTQQSENKMYSNTFQFRKKKKTRKIQSNEDIWKVIENSGDKQHEQNKAKQQFTHTMNKIFRLHL